jgi:hypothetical protein
MDMSKSSLTFLFIVIALAVFGFGWLMLSMPNVSFDGMAQMQATYNAVNAESELSCSELYSHQAPDSSNLHTRRCTYPDGLECVFVTGSGGVSCDWDAYHESH